MPAEQTLVPTTGRYTRRVVLAGGATCLVALAGCSSLTGGGSTGTDTYEITIVERDGTLAADIEPQGVGPGVVQVNVGDEVTFDVHNSLSVDVGVHNHVTDVEVTIEPDATHTMEFTPTDDQVGRHELEVFRVEGEHGGDEEHGNESSDHQEGTGEESGDHQEGTGEESGDHQEGEHEGVDVLTIEVRPAGS